MGHPAASRTELYRALENSYHNHGMLTRLYARLRARYYPLDELLKHLPSRGAIADVGCGRGTLARLLALALPSAHITGFEPSRARFEEARRIAGGLPNLDFGCHGWQTMPEGPFDAILLVDTLHHIPYAQQPDVLKSLCRRLTAGGTLLINETDPANRLRFAWNYLSDVLLYPREPRCYFRSREEMVGLLGGLGLKAVECLPVPQRYGFSTILYAAKASI